MGREVQPIWKTYTPPKPNRRTLKTKPEPLELRAANEGYATRFDDPIIDVRCSQLEDLCAGIISDRHRVALLDALSSVGDLAPVEVEAVAWLASLAEVDQ